MARLLIIGASRGIGLEAVKIGLEAGHQIRAFARSANHIAITHPSLEKISASALDRQAVDEAVENIDAVITTLGTPPTLQHVHLFSGTARTVTEAMKAKGVRKLIAVTGIGAGDSRGTGGLLYSRLFQPLFLGTIYEDKDLEEKIIKGSGLDWVIVRPGYLTRLPKTGTYRAVINPKDWQGGFITRTDVADFLIKQVDRDEFVGKTPLLISS